MPALTPWQQRKLRSLYDERHPIITRKFTGKALPNDEAVKRHIERQIDWYEAKLYREVHERNEALLHAMERAAYWMHRAAELRGTPVAGGGDGRDNG